MKLIELEKKPFKEKIIGNRINLLMPSTSERIVKELWNSILLDKNARQSGWTWLQSLDSLKKFLLQKEEEFKSNKSIFYLIEFNNKIIGTFSIHTLYYKDHKVEIGSWIEQTFEGRGLITEALNLIEDELRRLEFHKIILICDKENYRSIAFADKNGFMLEGKFKDDYIEDDKFVDSLHFGKIL